MLDALSQHTVLSKPFIHTNQLKWADPRDCVSFTYAVWYLCISASMQCGMVSPS